MNPAKTKTGAQGVEAVLIDIEDGSATFITPTGIREVQVPRQLRAQVLASRGLAVRLTVENGALRAIEPLAKSSKWHFESISHLAAEQGTQPVRSIRDLQADFWPEGESVDDFIAAAKGKPAS